MGKGGLKVILNMYTGKAVLLPPSSAPVDTIRVLTNRPEIKSDLKAIQKKFFANNLDYRAQGNSTF